MAAVVVDAVGSFFFSFVIFSHLWTVWLFVNPYNDCCRFNRSTASLLSSWSGSVCASWQHFGFGFPFEWFTTVSCFSYMSCCFFYFYCKHKMQQTYNAHIHQHHYCYWPAVFMRAPLQFRLTLLYGCEFVCVCIYQKPNKQFFIRK